MNLVDLIHQFSEINACKHLFLRKTWEPADNNLQILIEEASIGSEGSSITIGSKDISDLREIQSTNRSRVFEVSWDPLSSSGPYGNYVAYMMTNESYSLLEEFEKQDVGKLVRVYSNSPYLDYLLGRLAFIDGPNILPHVVEPNIKSLIHYRFVCLNHTLDVATDKKPVIRQIR